VADAHALPFADATFEQVISSEVLEHLHTPIKAAAEIARVLKPGGRLVLTVPMVYPVHEAPHDYHRFTEFGLYNLFSPHFQDIEIKALFTEEQTIAILLQRITMQRRDGRLRRGLYNLAARVIWNLSPRGEVARSMSISDNVPGVFLTAGYIVTGLKRGTTLQPTAAPAGHVFNGQE
jgi:SAM-dependent methyltransferase